jgi:GxxExxY protein
MLEAFEPLRPAQSVGPMITLRGWFPGASGSRNRRGKDRESTSPSVPSVPSVPQWFRKTKERAAKTMTKTASDQAHVDPRYPLSALTARIIAAAQEVHRALGPGFEEVIYQRALAKEFPVHGLEYSREAWIDVLYKGQEVGKKRVDFIVGEGSDAVMVEIKARGALLDVDIVQSLSYLKASGYRVGLLINFGGRKLEIKRLAN